MESILAIDVGGGTQDILLYEAGKPMENCVQLILPSQTVVVAQKIAKATQAGQAIYLHGRLMGGGACVSAIKKHLKQGLPVYASSYAAKTIADDLEKVTALGVELREEQPADSVAIPMGDLDLDTLAEVLRPYGVKLPTTVAAAVQDHGESIGFSNRLFRFKLWKGFIESGGDIRNLVHQDVPPSLTRMEAAIKGLPHAYVMDTGAAAIWGALCDPQVKKHQDEGLMVLNIGNQHTVGVLLQGFRIWGLFEHHTSLLTEKKLLHCIEALRTKSLTNAEVYDDGGHGCYIHPDYIPHGGYNFVAVTGPRRSLVENAGYYLAAPFGDMMLAGSFGLVAAIAAKK